MLKNAAKREDKPFSISTGSRLKSNGFKLQQRRVRLDCRRNFLLVTAVIPEKTLPMETVGSHRLRSGYWYSGVCSVAETQTIRLVQVLISVFSPGLGMQERDCT